MDSVFMILGSVMAGMIVQMVVMKQIVELHLAKTKVFLTVVMDSVFLQAMYAMDQVNSVMQDGDLTVLTAQMKA